MVGWHHRFNGYECEQALGVGDGQGSLVCCSLWGLKELDMTEQLSMHTLVNTDKKILLFSLRSNMGGYFYLMF